MATIVCRQCQRENDATFSFCLGCGVSLKNQQQASSGPKFCPQCGNETVAGQRFCGSCGFLLTSDGPSTSAPASSAPAAPAPAAPAPAPAAPAPSGHASRTGKKLGELTMVKPDGTTGEVFDLLEGDNIVGRSGIAPVFDRDPYLSPRHANFIVTPNDIRVLDLDSLNGVYYRINAKTVLQNGDHLRMGRELLRFTALDSAPRILTPKPGDSTHVFGSAPLGAWGRLERISGRDSASLTFLLRGREVEIGRERGDILFRDDGYVSGKHARVFTEDGRHFVEDLGSSNGTFVRIRKEHRIEKSALILMGQQPFRVTLL